MSCIFAASYPSSANTSTAASRIRIRRCSAGIRLLAIPNDNSVSFSYITEPLFGWSVMVQGAVRQRLHWLAVHGVVRGMSKFFARRGDPQGRLLVDPLLRAD